MVDADNIEKLLKQYFKIEGEVTIDDLGVVDVSGNVRLKKSCTKIPVTFGKVGGDFWCQDNQLMSLAGAPNHVGGDFSCHDNQLASLAGAPDHVGGDFWCYRNQLTSLAGAPDQVGGGFYCTWNKNLPLLRLLVYKDVFMNMSPSLVSKIINKYSGTTNPGDVLRCASELNEAGFEGNAEW